MRPRAGRTIADVRIAHAPHRSLYTSHSTVLGLTNAFELRERGYKVTLLARDLPQDSFSQTFASPWAVSRSSLHPHKHLSRSSVSDSFPLAPRLVFLNLIEQGANWCSFATLDDKPNQRRDEITFKKWLQLHTQLPPEVMAMVDFTDISPHRRDAKDVWFSSLTPDFGVVENGDGNGNHAIKYRSFTISVPLYTQWLISELTAAKPVLLDAKRAGPPATIRRCSTLSSLSAIRSLVPNCDLVINATGVGAGDLTDVRDDKVYPIRGQTVLISVPSFQAPHQNARCVMKLGSPANYVIPRARSGQVILGGSFDIRQSSTTPDKELAEKIMQECSKLVPEIVPQGKTWREIEVISHNVGLRPAREGGVRVELEEIKGDHGKQGLTVVHSYGIGPAGYQASFGIAQEVGDLVDGWISKKGGNKVQARL